MTQPKPGTTTAGGIEDVYPLTPLQQGMLLESRLAPGSGVYWVQVGLLLEGELDLGALLGAWDAVVARHAVLRSGVLWDRVAVPVSVVSRTGLWWRVVDVTGLGEAAAERVLSGLLAADAAQGADFGAPSLMRVLVVVLGGGRWQVVWGHHHLLLDGWSVAIVLGEMLAACRALAAGGVAADALMVERRPFRDFVAWVSGLDQVAAAGYWRERLAGIGPAAPVGVERVSGRSGGGRYRAAVPDGVTGALRGTARRHRMTLNTVVQGAWAVLLAGYGGSGDVVFGVTTSGRGEQLDGMEGMVGLLINTTPARVRVDRDVPVAAWLRRLQREQAQGREFEQTPLVAIQAAAGVPAGQPLFTTLFVFENYPANELNEGGVSRLRAEENFFHWRVNYPLTVIARSRPGLAIDFSYDRARFDDAVIERMGAHLLALLQAMADDLDQQVGDLSVLTADERRRLLVTWNDTAAPIPAAGAAELVAERVATAPDAVAAEYGGSWLSYRGLADRAGRLAGYLRFAGVGAETVVGLGLDRGLDMIVAMLAVWQAGGAYLPLDPDYPPGRLAFMLADGGAQVLIGRRARAANLAHGQRDDLTTVWLDDPGVQAALATSAVTAATPVLSGQLAYVMYTSGSTGRPKGIGVCQRDVAALVTSGDYVTIQADDVMGQVATASFDAATFEIWGALANGASLAGVDRDVLLSPRLLGAEIGRRAITVMFLTGAVFSQMASEDPGGLRTMRHLLVGGEAVDPPSARRVLELGAPLRLLNGYGPTETTTFAVWHEIRDVADGTVPIGRPLANMRAHVLDRAMSLVPVGAAGELFLGGAGLARGYLGRPALTAERFVADPYAADGSRLYRTGDRVRWLVHGAIGNPGRTAAAGVLEFLGRADDQVKVRGFRIEPGEIEVILAGHPGVRSAVVAAFGDGTGRRLVAYLTPADHGEGIPSVAELRGYLTDRLPDFMVPSVFVELASLPLTPNGKLDRAALPMPDTGRLVPATGYAAPSTPAEELLAGIWARVLGVDRVGAGDSFFELGGHSLLATRVISQVRDMFGVEVPLSALFDRPTVAGLARVVGASAPGPGAPPVTRANRDRRLPLSFAQQRLWFMDQLEPGATEYNVPLRQPMPGSLDVRALGAALDLVVARHEVLRTRLVADADGVARQVIDSPPAFPLPVADVSAQSDPLAAALALAAADTATVFDMAAGPLIRAVLIRLGPADHLLAVSVHHVIFDEWSAGIFRHELTALYEGLRAGPERAAALPPLPVQYADFAVWQREWLTGEVLAGQLSYWRRQLAGLPVLELPADRPRPPARSRAGAVARFEVPAEVTAGLRAVARRAGATMFMTSLATFAVLLGRYTGLDDVMVGTPVANRSRAEIEGLIGFFVNTLVLRADLSGDPSFTELLGRVRRVTMDGYAHQDLPFEQLVDELVTVRDRSRTPLFQVLFNYFRVDDTTALAGDGDVVAKYDLRLILTDDGNVAGAIEYGTALFDASTIDRMAGHLVALLAAVAADPGLRVAELGMLSAAERDALRAWNDTAFAMPAANAVHELVAGHVAARPDAAAVVCGGRWLTYAGLWKRSGRLAGYLRSAGVGAESVVGVCLQRTPLMVAAVLAVWRAGAAFLPLDSEYPPERLAFMLADSRAAVLVGTSAVAGELPAGRIRVVLLDDPATAAAVARAPEPDAPQQHGDQLAYVIYTSGSTGTPKGVLVPHGALLNLAVQGTAFGVGEGDVLLGFAPFGFDGSVWERVTALSAGGTLAMATAQERAEPTRLAQMIRGLGVKTCALPPPVFSVLEPGDLDGLVTLIAAGERLDPGLAGAWRGRHRMLNAYGPTEAAVCVCAGVVEEGEAVPPIGPPLGNCRLYVLDARMGLVPVGVAGELWIGGTQVARGYGRRPALTAERFAADRFAADGSRMYRTGDRARWRPDGQLEFLGRADDQLKVRGFRVEPGEVEAALAAHPEVRAAVVTADGTGADRRLVAYLVPAHPDTGIPSPAELHGFMRGRLPEFMVPAIFTELASLPLTANGKLDKAALPAPDADGLDRGQFVAPSGVTEELLAGIWAQVLGIGRVGARDSFFELGGHSLLATQVISRVREVFDVEVPLSALFDHPTVGGLGAVIEGSSPGAAAPPVVAVGRDRWLPLSFAQQRLWFLDQLEPGATEYSAPMPIRLAGELHVRALGAALSAVVARHEVLRTRLVADADGAVGQVIDPPSAFPLPVADVSARDDPLACARDLVAVDAATPFDLAAGRPIRGCLIRLAPDDHALALSLHHVAFDEWSAGIFRRELDHFYRAARAGREDPLPPLPVQYADFAVWQREWLSGPVLEGQLAYWRQQLAGLPVLELPADRPRPPVRSPAGAVTGFTVSAEIITQLRDVARQAGATMFMTLLAGFAVLLGRYTGLDDVAVGTPVANRGRAETDGLIGFFLNTLVTRTDLSGDPSFAGLLARVRSMALAAYAHQDLPFEQLVDELVTERDRSRSPLFQVLFNYLTEDEREAGPGRVGDGADAGASALGGALVVAKFDVRLIVAEEGGGLAGAVEYATALFDEASAVRLAGHLVTVLAAVAGDPARRVGDVGVLTAGERDQLAGWNETAVAVLAPAGGVWELVAGRGAVMPDAVAVVCGAGVLTYGGLVARAGRLAGYLAGLGAGPESVVGLCLAGGADLLVGVLGVWAAGAAYLPLDPGYPAGRLGFMLADSRASVVVGTARVLDELPAGRVRAVAVDDPAVAAAVAAAPAAGGLAGVGGDRLAYVMYTSGSTGTPKGVLVTQGGLVNYLGWVAGRTGLGVPGGRYGLVQGAGTDFGNTVVFTCLATGGTLHVLDGAMVTEYAAVAGYVARHGIDYLKLVPSHLGALAGGGELGGLVPGRVLVVGGEALPPSLAGQLLAVAGDRAVVNHYGPTETTIGVVTARLGPGLVGGGRVPIGGPVANTRVYVLDRRLNLLPVGVAGELWVGGAQVARGYAGRPGLTAERFVADRFAGDGGRLYRTGDLARWRADGLLEFAGRVDDQVKVRGFRAEPGEAQAALAAHPAVAAAAVVADGEGAGRRLVAYLVPGAGAGLPAAGDLRAFLAGRLPGFLVPSVFCELAALPLTGNGKLDRSALPDPDAARADGGDYVAPSTPAEELLAGIFARVLGVDRVGAQDGFFDLGGHSLLATQVIARVRETFGVDVPLAGLFDRPTVAGFAGVLAAAEPGLAAPPVTPAGRDRPLPLSFAQQRLWFLHQLEPGSTEYNVPLPERLGGDLDVAALGAALTAVVARHEVLRTRLVAGPDGVPWQVIDPPLPFPLPVADVSGCEAPLAQARRLVAADARAPFDLAAGPLIRACLVRLGPADHLLALSAHHVVFDERSAVIFRRELDALYRALRVGEPDALPPLPVQYADFAVWQRTWLAGEVLPGQLAYWRGQLSGLPVLELPADRPRPAVRSSAGAITEFTVPAEVAARLRGAARDAGATMFMTLLAAFSVLLGRHCGLDDIVVGTAVANRDRAETEDLIGFFINTLVMRADLSGDPSFTGLLSRVRAMALEAYAHQDLPFEQLVDELVTERDRSRTPLFQVFFSHTEGNAGDDAGWGQAAEARIGTLPVKFDVSFRLAEAGDGGLAGGVQYSTALFDEATVRRMAGHLVTVLEAVAADPGGPVADLPVLTGSERDLLVTAWNDTAAPVPGHSLPELIAAAAAAAPDAVAVTCGGRAVTYAALLARAARLAARLRDVGAGRESVTGVCLDRGVDMVAAVLGVWAAGGAYLPLDPGYPAGRLGFMAADSGMRVLVAHRAAAGAVVGLDPAVPVVWLDDAGAAAGPGTARPGAVMPAVPAVPAAAAPDQLAYVIYTSGSTGAPKGVQVGHGSLANLVAAVGPRLGAGPAARVLQFASFSFDASVLDVAAVLAGGGTLVVATAAQRAEPERLAAMVAAQGVTGVSVAPSLLGALDPQALGGVSHVIAGSERVSAAVARAWAPGRSLVVGYGPTECTVICSTGVVDPRAEVAPPVGGPGGRVANTRLYVLDGRLDLVPVGVAGELWIGGAQVARGYAGRPALTAERFVADRFARNGSRLYRSGDRVRWRADGRLEFVGRADDQVKVRGFRVEPGEVEAVLAAHPGVAAAVVTAFGTGSDARLAAYLVPDDPAAGAPAAAALRAFARERLPEFMVPSVITELGELPLTPGGKVDRAALPAPEPRLAGVFVPPSGPVQELLAGIWAQVLGLDRVGAADNFFELGGHSLLATRVISRVREVLRSDVPLAALFDQPTVAGLAGIIEGPARGAAAPPVVAAGREGRLPLSFAQQRLWFLDQLDPGSAEYVVPVPQRWRGALDVAELGAALSAMVARHEILRTRLVADADGVAGQVIDPPRRLGLNVADVSGAPDPGRAARDLVAADAAAPFDLAAGPSVRVCLIRLAPDDQLLALSAHHVFFDEWSAGIWRRDLKVLYEASRSRDSRQALPPLPVQYADYAVWQREWLTSGGVAGQLAYWRRQLAGVPTLELPADRPRPPVRSTAGAMAAFRVPPETAAGLRGAGRRGGATMFMTSLAGFGVLLSRYCGADDVVIGTPVAGRNRAETEDLIGFFVNTLVMRADLSGDPAFTEVVARVRAMALEAYAHQDLPFEQLVDELVTERDRSRTPLFQVMFSYFTDQERQIVADASLGHPRADVIARFDLRLILVEDDGGLSGALEYSSAMFDAATAERMAGHLATLLRAVAADPARRLSAQSMLSAAERDQLLTAWNTNAREMPPGQTRPGGVHDLVAAQAAARPDAIATGFGGRWLSYAGMARRAARLANYLRGIGVGNETIVGLCLERGPDMIVAMLAVWQAGGAYLPLDPEYPAQRRGLMLADSGARVLIGRSARRAAPPEVPADDPPTVWLDDPEVRAALAAASPVAPVTMVLGAQLAYVVYTSGSTGRPKGIGVCHRDIAARVAGCDYITIEPGDVVAQTASTSYDAAVFEIWGALANGASLAGIDRDVLLWPPSLAAEIEQRGITVLFLITALFSQLATEAPRGLRTVRQLLFGGEMVDPLTVRRAIEQGRPHRILHMYGPAEATTFATWQHVTDVIGRTVPIGRPLAGMRTYVLDRAMAPVPIGVEGELFIGGAGLARGYLGRPGLTAERFVADLVAGDGTRMYRSGDLVRWNGQGQLEFLGRVDGQLKIRGFRVEPGEVEAVLLGHAGVGAVVVAGVPVAGEGDRRRLVAYVVGAGGGAVPSAGELRGFLRGRLPEFMVPGVFVELAGLPLTVNGKVDRSRLPGVGGVGGGSGAVFVAPRSGVERVLAGVWAQVLGVERVGVEDNFFELGGDSIISVQVVARARAAGVVVSAAQLFEHQTVAALAGVASGGVPVVAGQGPVAGEFGLSPIQRWFFGRGLPVPGHFNQSVLAEVAGRVDAGVLSVAVAGVVAHHDGLRSRFGVRGGEWAGWVVAREDAELVWVVDAAGAGDEAALLEERGGAAQASLDLERGPLVRVVLFERGAAGQLLLVVAHHLVVDTVSWPIVLEDLSAAYGQAERGEPVVLPAKTTSFAQWSQRLGVLAGSGELAGEAAWWEAVARAGGVLPRDLGGANAVASARQVAVVLGAGQTSRLLREVPGAYRTQVNDVLLTALGVVLTGFAGAGSVVVDLEGHGREEAAAGAPGVDLSRTVGWFTSMFPVVLAGAPGGDLGAALRATKEYLRAVPRRGLGYGVARFAGGAGGADAAVSFNYMGQFARGAGRGGQRFTATGRQLGAARSAAGQRSHLIEINAQVGADGQLAVVWTYSDQVHHEATVAGLAQRYVQVLDELIEHCCQPGAGGYTPSDFPLAGLDQAALDALTARFGTTSPATPAPGTGGRP